MAGDPAADVVRADLLPGWRTASGEHVAALRFRLADGWKTYWRAPGDAGIPPLFDWQGSRNFGVAEVVWPTPAAFSQNGMRSIGYKSDVILPIRITPRDHDADIHLNVTADIGVCKDICVPKRLRARAILPAGTKQVAPAIAAALAERPLSAQEAGVQSATCRFAPSEHGIAVTANVALPSAGHPEIVVIEAGTPDIWVAEAAAQRQGGTLSATTEMMLVDGGPVLLDRSRIRLTVLGARHAVDIQGCRAE